MNVNYLGYYSGCRCVVYCDESDVCNINCMINQSCFIDRLLFIVMANVKSIADLKKNIVQH